LHSEVLPKQGCGFILAQIRVVGSEILSNKLEVAKRLKTYVGGTTFVEVLRLLKYLHVRKKVLKSRFVVFRKSAVTLFSLMLTEKTIF